MQQASQRLRYIRSRLLDTSRGFLQRLLRTVVASPIEISMRFDQRIIDD